MGVLANKFEEILEEHEIMWHHMIRGLIAKGRSNGIYAYGPPATGKSTVLTQGDVIDVTLDKDEGTMDVFWRQVFESVKDDKGNVIPGVINIKYELGPACIAFVEGKRLVVNEAQFVSSWGKWYALTDTRPNAVMTMPDGRVLQRHAKFECVMTSNNPPEEVLPEGMLSRFPRRIRCATPTPEALESLGDDKLAHMVLNTYLSLEKGRKAGSGGNDELAVDFRKAQAFLEDVKAITFDLAVQVHFPDKEEEFKCAYALMGAK